MLCNAYFGSSVFIDISLKNLKTKFENCNTVIEMWPSVVHITTMRNGEK